MLDGAIDGMILFSDGILVGAVTLAGDLMQAGAGTILGSIGIDGIALGVEVDLPTMLVSMTELLILD